MQASSTDQPAAVGHEAPPGAAAAHTRGRTAAVRPAERRRGAGSGASAAGDAHERELFEERLRQSEARYRSLFNSIDEGFCIIEMLFCVDGKALDYRFCETNPAFVANTGLVGAEGRRMRDLVPEHEEFWFETYGKVALTGEPVRTSYEARAMGRWFDLYAFRIDNPAEHKVAILFKDVSVAKRAEEALVEADRRKDEFVAMLAHELRNPLAPIGAAAAMLAKGGLDEAGLKHAGRVIARQVKNMTEMVDDLLDVSRVARGLVPLRRERVDAVRVATDAVEQARPAIEARSHTLTVHVPASQAGTASQACVLGDHKRLVQVLANLLHNAAKFTPEGGEIELCIEIELAGAQPLLRITVSDDGDGMEPDLLARAFDLFVQGEQCAGLAVQPSQPGQPGHATGGLGIGLALVKRLVELHQGRVEAHSAGPGQGSRFTVWLPLA